LAPRVRVSIRDLAKTFGQGPREVLAVSPVSFDVHEREFVAIVGPSGCGKSTILNMIGGLVTPTAGAVEIDGAPVVASAPRQVGYVFQKDTVFPWRTVARNIAVGLEYRGMARAEQERRVREAIGLAGLSGFEEAFPATLSGGMRQRVALMRTLVVEPEILLMDEPASALDPIATQRIEELIYQLKSRYTIVIVTHNMQQAARVSDVTAFFWLGKLVECDRTNKMFTAPSEKLTEDYVTGRFG
jgi:ABC-type phosphate transport system ATPase subunit